MGRSYQCRLQVIVSPLARAVVVNISHVQRVNSAGGSEWSMTTSVQTQSIPPSAPGTPVLQEASGSSLSVQWDSATSVGCPVLFYMLDYQDLGPIRGTGEGKGKRKSKSAGFKRGYSGPATVKVLKNLKPKWRYGVRVAAVNSAGQGPWVTTSFSTQGAGESVYMSAAL